MQCSSLDTAVLQCPRGTGTRAPLPGRRRSNPCILHWNGIGLKGSGWGGARSWSIMDGGGGADVCGSRSGSGNIPLQWVQDQGRENPDPILTHRGYSVWRGGGSRQTQDLLLFKEKRCVCVCVCLSVCLSVYEGGHKGLGVSVPVSKPSGGVVLWNCSVSSGSPGALLLTPRRAPYIPE